MTKKTQPRREPNGEPFIKWSKALELVKADWPDTPTGALYAAVRAGKIPHRRSSDAKRARISVRITDLKTYIRSLTWAAKT